MIEQRRRCGFKQVHKLYLEADPILNECDRTILLEVCPTCGHGVKQQRGWNAIRPAAMFGEHGDGCTCPPTCLLCSPRDGVHGLLWVGTKFYPSPEDFVIEVASQGVSKAVPCIPHWFELGKTIVYLAHPRCSISKNIGLVTETETETKRPAVFMAFRPKQFTMLFWESERGSRHVQEIEKRGVVVKYVPDGDTDHMR